MKIVEVVDKFHLFIKEFAKRKKSFVIVQVKTFLANENKILSRLFVLFHL